MSYLIMFSMLTILTQPIYIQCCNDRTFHYTHQLEPNTEQDKTLKVIRQIDRNKRCIYLYTHKRVAVGIYGVRLHTSHFSPNHRAAICHLDHYFVYKSA